MMLLFNIYVFLASSILMATATSPHAQEFSFNYISVCEGNYGKVLETHLRVPSRIACVTLCSHSSHCASGLYNKGTKSCRLNMEEWPIYVTTGCSLDVLYFERAFGLLSCIPRDSCTVPYKGIRLCEGGGPGVCDPSKGRIEVFYQAKWGTVFDDFWESRHKPQHYFGDRNANVVCRMLGYTSGTAKMKSSYGGGSIPILLDDVKCQEGNETSLFACPALYGDTKHNCGHHEDVGVSCS